jgi:hypothetical protein
VKVLGRDHSPGGKLILQCDRGLNRGDKFELTATPSAERAARGLLDFIAR